MSITIFYSWQSDTDQKYNRYFIRDAAKLAVKELNEDYAVEDSPREEEFSLDHDTAGVPGHPVIIDEILKKIKNCQIFLADLTFVGSTKGHKAKNQTSQKKPQNTKYLPNPNVMFELGYASSVLSDRQLILVMNDEYGSANKRVFNIGHRRDPIKFRVHCDAEGIAKKKEQAELKRKIKSAIETMVNQGVFSENRQKEIQLEKKAIASLQSETTLFFEKVKCGEFYVDSKDRPVVALCIFPAKPLDSPIDLENHLEDVRSGMRPIYGKPRGGPEISDPLLIQRGSLNAGEQTSVVTLDINKGTIYSASLHNSFGSLIDYGVKTFEATSIQTRITESIKGYLGMLRKIRVKGPWFVGMALLNLPECFVIYPGHEPLDHSFVGGDITLSLQHIPDKADFSSVEKTADLLKSSFDQIWRKFGFFYCHSLR